MNDEHEHIIEAARDAKIMEENSILKECGETSKHDPFEGYCVHCGVPFADGIPLPVMNNLLKRKEHYKKILREAEDQLVRTSKAARAIHERPGMVSGSLEMAECDALCKSVGLEVWTWPVVLPSHSRILTCVYCGHEYPQDTPAAGSEVLTEHIKVCDRHPLRKAERTIASLHDALEQLIDNTDIPPDKNCRCFISPPCNDCVEYSSIREALSDAYAAIKMVNQS